ncbi:MULTISPECIES: autotransporter outer membrane beta-barrel domain-containing protein [Mycobacteriaceae]|uniref:hypothetical protein n=1 Tax=Mycobacteriaceae TaxID=1762 RepID=UPI001115B9EB|nr:MULTISPECIES: hypothetical protein [Mycobacteriaceae]MDO3058469.1 hypothetical protein [Mycobacteroides abscessus subsp. abscessus]MDO3277995.1 hypothetical protein [Mycobacteroides abscessus subsp. abscessus]
MPRVVDRRPRRVADKDPLAGLLGYDLTEAAGYAGQGIRDFMLQIRDTWAQWLKDATGIDLTAATEFFDWFIDQLISRSELDLSSPQALVASLGDLLKNGAEQLFNGIISISRIGDVIQDLINGAGEFLNVDSVDANPFWSWDSVMPGWLSGGSIRAAANGTEQVLRKDNPFDVFEGQVLNLRAGTRWTGLTATAGSNPIKVGWTPYDANGNPMADVIKGVLQPSTTDAADWQPIPTDEWIVPAGVAKVTPLVILDTGATAGTVWISNVRPWASNLLPTHLVDGLEAALTDFTNRIKGLFDTIGGAVDATIDDIEARLAAIGADGKIDAAELWNIANIPAIAIGKISGLAAQLADFALKSAIQTFMDTVGGTVGASMTDIFNRLSKLSSTGQINGATGIAGAISEAQTGVTAVRDAFVNGMVGLLGGGGSGFSNTDAQNQTTQLAVLAQQAAAAAAAIQAQYQRNQVAAPSGLMTYITTFGGSDGSALPAEFTGTDLKIRTANGYCGIDASKADGTYYVTCNKQTTTDDVQTTVVIGDAGGLNSIATYTLFSSDSTDSTGAYLAVNGNTVQVGKYTRSGATFTFAAPFMSWSGPIGQGIAVTTYRKTNNWVLDVGGDVKATATNSTVTTGASNRYGGGIVMMRKTSSGGWFSGSYQYDSMRLASVFLGDFYAKATNYTGARLTRAVGAANTAGPTHPYSLAGNASTTVTGAWGAGAFGVIGFNSDDVTPNTANGTITVNTSGLYYVEHRDPAWTWTAGTAIEPSASALDVVVNTVNHITLEGDYKLLDGTANTDTGSWGVTGHSAVPIPAFVRLNAGDVIQLGYTVTLKNTGGSSRSGNAVFTLTGTTLGLLGIYKMG